MLDVAWLLLWPKWSVSSFYERATSSNHQATSSTGCRPDHTIFAFTLSPKLRFFIGWLYGCCCGSTIGSSVQTALSPHWVRGWVPSKLTLGQSGDRFEQEADSIAKAIVGQERQVRRQPVSKEDEKEILFNVKRFHNRRHPECSSGHGRFGNQRRCKKL